MEIHTYEMKQWNIWRNIVCVILMLPRFTEWLIFNTWIIYIDIYFWIKRKKLSKFTRLGSKYAESTRWTKNRRCNSFVRLTFVTFLKHDTTFRSNCSNVVNCFSEFAKFEEKRNLILAFDRFFFFFFFFFLVWLADNTKTESNIPCTNCYLSMLILRMKDLNIYS